MSLLPLSLLTLGCGDKDDTGGGGNAADDHVWGYSAEGGAVPPDQWSEYWPACDGDMQSPVDIADEVVKPGGEVEVGLLWGDTTIEVENNGHNLEWVVDGGNGALWQGTAYELKQFHFHSPSEHTRNGVPYDMEMHVVHQDPVTGDRLVVAVWIQEGDQSAFLDAIGWDSLPVGEGETYTSEEIVALAESLPAGFEEAPTIFRYPGSLTTPPCDENVQWVVASTPIPATAAQIQTFLDAVGENARPTQALGNRRINESTVVAPE